MSLFPLFIHDLLKWTELLFFSYFLYQILGCCCRILFTRWILNSCIFIRLNSCIFIRSFGPCLCKWWAVCVFLKDQKCDAKCFKIRNKTQQHKRENPMMTIKMLALPISNEFEWKLQTNRHADIFSSIGTLFISQLLVKNRQTV